MRFPQDPAAIDQFFRAIAPNTGPGAWEGADPEVTSNAVSALFDRIGPGVLLTHSASGGPGWLAAIKNQNVRAIIAYEPVRFEFPEGELPPPQPGGLPQQEIPLSEFMKLTKIPIQIVFRDNLEQSPVFWSAPPVYAKAFVDAVNRHGGDASLLHLPDIGIYGNTHFSFADLNNVQIADLLSAYVHEKGLDKRDRPHKGPREKLVARAVAAGTGGAGMSLGWPRSTSRSSRSASAGGTWHMVSTAVDSVVGAPGAKGLKLGAF